MKYKIEVEPGCIEINSVAPLFASKNALLFEVDTRQKYPMLLGAGTGTAIIGIGEETIKLNEDLRDKPASVVRIRLIDDRSDRHWHTTVEAGRYSIYIGMFDIGQDCSEAPFWIRKENE